MKGFHVVRLLIEGLRVPFYVDEGEILKKASDKMKRAGVNPSTLHFRLYKKSIDARRREDICFVCTVLAEGSLSRRDASDAVLSKIPAKRMESEPLNPVFGSEQLSGRPLVVGMGPAGLFAALLLARNGYAPVLIDRGAPVEERVKDVKRFRESGVLNTESNIQFGAGGAGTFSDGKLITRIHDPRCSFVLETLCSFGAPEDILVSAKPHVGTDLLRRVVTGILEEIVRLGGEVRYHCRLESFHEASNGLVHVATNQGSLSCGAIILAPGHSARDTYLMMIQKGMAIEPKPISVGVRAEHLRQQIDEALYGKYAGDPRLGAAEYALSDTKGERGVYSFCMCPGGEVVAAASEEGGLVVNGMSYHARNSKNSNAAIVASVHPNDVPPVDGNMALGMIEFQRKTERAAYAAGGGAYYAPVMTMGDFLSERTGTEPGEVLPSYRDGAVRVSDFDKIFPPFVTRSLRYGFQEFGKKIRGYDAPQAVLTAAETRTSAPLRILRNPETLTAPGYQSIYPCGEGAGYAGGITSAAVDGVRCSLALMARYKPLADSAEGDKL